MYFENREKNEFFCLTKIKKALCLGCVVISTTSAKDFHIGFTEKNKKNRTRSNIFIDLYGSIFTPKRSLSITARQHTTHLTVSWTFPNVPVGTDPRPQWKIKYFSQVSLCPLSERWDLITKTETRQFVSRGRSHLTIKTKMNLRKYLNHRFLVQPRPSNMNLQNTGISFTFEVPALDDLHVQDLHMWKQTTLNFSKTCSWNEFQL